jgi:hypothetical protein
MIKIQIVVKKTVAVWVIIDLSTEYMFSAEKEKTNASYEINITLWLGLSCNLDGWVYWPVNLIDIAS